MIKGSESGSAKPSESSFRLSSEAEEDQSAFELTDMTTYQQMPHSDSNVI